MEATPACCCHHRHSCRCLVHRERERLLVVEEEEYHSFDFVDSSMELPAELLLVLLQAVVL